MHFMLIGYLNNHVAKPNSNPLYISIYQSNKVQEIINLSTKVGGGANKKLYVTVNMQNRHR
jgi:hypothetical protein